ncbi:MULTISPECIES: hypothetical protein [Bradyrhizobium]|uniref:hypothetical protein n=1 Tax=Bradyrhizobium TaxID=374 RepID=UPI0013E8C88B|nr:MULTISPECIES: hypothetical protein [Bradyrhizobium]
MAESEKLAKEKNSVVCARTAPLPVGPARRCKRRFVPSSSRETAAQCAVVPSQIISVCEGPAFLPVTIRPRSAEDVSYDGGTRRLCREAGLLRLAAIVLMHFACMSLIV